MTSGSGGGDEKFVRYWGFEKSKFGEFTEALVHANVVVRKKGAIVLLSLSDYDSFLCKN